MSKAREQLEAYQSRIAGVAAALSFAALLEISGRKPLEGPTYWAFAGFLLSGLLCGFFVFVPAEKVYYEVKFFAWLHEAAWRYGFLTFLFGVNRLVASVDAILALVVTIAASVLFVAMCLYTERARKMVAEVDEELKAVGLPPLGDSSSTPPASAG